MLSFILNSASASAHPEHELRSLPASFQGKVLLRKKGFLSLNDQFAQIGDAVSEFLGDKVSFQLVSAHQLSAGADGIGSASPQVQLSNWNEEIETLAADEGTLLSIAFPVGEDFGNPGALLVTNKHRHEFYLSSVTVSPSDDSTREFHFPCNSWIYNTEDSESPRIFFTNKALLPSETPQGIRKLRNAELKSLQGDGTGERKQRDRIYDYDVYNDLGNPDEGKEYARRTLGGSKDYPYPRRCRTGRESTVSDPNAEKPSSTLDLIYVPRDEIFDHRKTSDFLASSLKAIAHLLVPAVSDALSGKHQFESLEEVNAIYVKGLDLPISSSKEKRDGTKSGRELISELSTDKDAVDSGSLKFPLPQIIATSKDAWNTDEEFGRQALGGMHPIIIERLTVFPPSSQLDPSVYGPPSSSIKPDDIEPYLEGMSVDEALRKNKLYTIDYHDAFLPYIKRINALEDHKTYASRTIFFLTEKGTLKPVAIELCLPSENGRVDRVFVPPQSGNNEEQKWLWRLSKTHAILNDTPVHQLISHLLRTHVTMEAFIIASHRQLSAMHPLLVLLLPHFKNTLNINALARKILINAYSGNTLSGGIVEQTFTAGRYALEISSVMYRNWRFDEQGLPADLIKRGMAVRDPKAKHGLRLLIEDYPYAVDGLDIWSAIESWVDEYVRIYYKNDKTVVNDTELQNWWQEIREKGHEDKKDELWWLPMDSIGNVISIVTTIIWLASAHHAAVNFGQYPYAGYMPYRPTMGRKLIPLPNTAEYETFMENPEAFLLESVSSPFQTAIGLAIIEVLSTHASDEEYLGQRSTKHWTDNRMVMDAFKRFQERLLEVERAIIERNEDASLVNRYGEVQVPYTLLFPRSGEGITNKGIPNSTSI